MNENKASNLASALAEIQTNLKDPKKNQKASIPLKTGKEITFNYADLPELLKVIRPVIGPAGLSVSSAMFVQDGMLVLKSTLMHASGESTSTEYPVSAIAADHKAIGAGITYGLRRNNQILLNISAEDDKDIGGTGAPNIRSSAQAKRDGVWKEFQSDLEDVHTLTALDRLIRYNETNVYPTLKHSWRAQMDGEFDDRRQTLSKPVDSPDQKMPDEMSNADLDQLALEHDEREQHPLEAG